MSMNQNDQVEMYKREVANVEPLSTEEQAYFFREASKAGTHGENAKRRLLESTLHLVLGVAERHASSGLSTLDLIQEGNLGLMRALDDFEGNSLDDFSGFATAYIESSIRDATARSK
jgi:DNA-directed RNA polymerase sigma subunit (sigma70/sigma32)